MIYPRLLLRGEIKSIDQQKCFLSGVVIKINVVFFDIREILLKT